MSENNIPVKEIGELLNEVSDKVPGLIKGLLSSLYSAEAGRNMGQAVGALYKELVDAGIPKETALDMAKEYILSLKSIVSNNITQNMKDKSKDASHGDE